MIDDEPVLLNSREASPPPPPPPPAPRHTQIVRLTSPATRATRTSRGASHEQQPPTITLDAAIPLKTRQRDAQFKKMLQLQSQEIDSTLGELKTKILKLVQMSNMKSQLDGDLLTSAGLCTKRFNRAVRKSLVELAHINDRVVKDYVYWKKKTDKAAAAVKADTASSGPGAEIEEEEMSVINPR